MKATTFLSLAIFAFQAPQTFAASSVCSSGIYAALAPLDNYPPAVSYCQGQAGKATVTVTVSAAAKVKREPATKATTTTTTTKSTTTTTLKTSTTKTTADAKASSWSSLVAQAKSVVATFCSCAGYPATITTSTTLKPTPTPTPTPTSTTPTVSTCRNGASAGQVCQPTPSADEGNYSGFESSCYSDCDDVSNYGQGCVGASVNANGECFFNINCCLQY